MKEEIIIAISYVVVLVIGFFLGRIVTKVLEGTFLAKEKKV